jgi:4-amino-4-deoxy-L-arabinose transferase-like glycosyltransferase
MSSPARSARLLGLAVVVAAAAVLDLVRISQNGYANLFYSAGVRSMLRSLHNFVFVSFDSGGLISIDKPPLALWVQALSAKLFGFGPLSLLLPEAIVGVLVVAALYLILARRLGTLAAFAGALAAAVFPSFVAVSRENGVDPLLILLMLLACGAALRACESGRLRHLLLSGVLVGLAFNVKTLAAYLVVPGIAAAFVVCAPGSPARRAAQLAAAGLAALAVSFAWIAFVEATPASERPYVGGSTDNTQLGLTFDYNGFGRVEGQAGGPNTTVVRPGARVPPGQIVHSPRFKPSQLRSHQPAAASGARSGLAASRGPSAGSGAGGRARFPIPFGGAPGPLRLFGVGLGDQGGWTLPFALFGLLALALLVLSQWRQRGRRDPRVATLLVLGGWFLVEAVVLSASKGIVHPYYVSALAPATGAMAGAGLVALAQLARSRLRVAALALSGLAVAATVAAQAVLAHREHYMHWFLVVLALAAIVLGGALALLVLLRRRGVTAVLGALFALLLVLPAGYASTTWLAPVEGTFPAAGPRQAAGSNNGYGVSDRDLAIDMAILRYVKAHRPGTRWELLTVASDTGAPMMLKGMKAGALGGYSGTDPALDGRALARYVARRQARWVLLGGEYSLRGGNLATKAVLRACRQLPASAWSSPVPYPYGLVLFDCAGRARQLAA